MSKFASVSILNSIPLSKRRFYIKTITSMPTGDRNMRIRYEQPIYQIMERPVSPEGERDSFYGEKTKCVGLPYTDKEYANEIVNAKNERFHVKFAF